MRREAKAAASSEEEDCRAASSQSATRKGNDLGALPHSYAPEQRFEEDQAPLPSEGDDGDAANTDDGEDWL